MKKNKNGFTLIELLAVIVVLAIIALIATPMVLNTIETAKEGSNLRSVEGIASAVEETVYRIMMESNYKSGDIICKTEEGKITCYEEDNITVSKDVTYKGNKITTGTIKYNHKLELLVMTNIKFESSDNSYVYTTVGGASKTTPDECFDITEDGALSASSSFSKNNKCTSDLVIPSEVNGIKVVEVEDEAFAGYKSDIKLTSVVISEGIEKIGDAAFSRNEITYVILPDSLSDMSEQSIFYDNKITYVNLPENLELGGDNFSRNNIETLFLPKGIIFNGLDDFENSNIKNLIIEDGLTEIGDDSFYCNLIEELVIPGSVKIIGASAFYDNKITKLTLNEGLEEIYTFAFEENNLTSVTIPSTVTLIENDAFLENENLTTIVNKTNRAFDWGSILGGSKSTPQVTGTYVIDGRTVNVIAE